MRLAFELELVPELELVAVAVASKFELAAEFATVTARKFERLALSEFAAKLFLSAALKFVAAPRFEFAADLKLFLSAAIKFVAAPKFEFAADLRLFLPVELELLVAPKFGFVAGRAPLN